jgi:benzoylformate decarboxylase
LPFAIGQLTAKLAGHDLILVFGAPVFRYHEYVPGAYLPEGAQLVAITSDPAEAARAPVGEAIVADPQLVLCQLVRCRRAFRATAARATAATGASD